MGTTHEYLAHDSFTHSRLCYYAGNASLFGGLPGGHNSHDSRLHEGIFITMVQWSHVKPMGDYMEPLVIRRYGQPNKEDQLPKGTICIVENVNFPREVWIQKSKDSENPLWELQDQNSSSNHPLTLVG